MRTKEELEDEIYYQKDSISKKQFMIDLFNADINKYNSELKYLQKELEELNKSKRWKPEVGDAYYAIIDGKVKIILSWNDDESDQFRHKTRNCFKTKEEAEEELERILFVNEVRDFIEEENRGYEIKYEGINPIHRYYLCYNLYNKTFFFKWFNSEEELIYPLGKTYPHDEIGEKILAKFDNQKLIKWWI